MMSSIFLLNFLILLSYGQQIEKNPRNQYVRLFSDVIFECKVSGFNPVEDRIEWCKNDFCTWGRLSGNKNTDEHLQYKSLPKYFIVGKRQQGEWNLLIKNVTERELGEYKCTLTRKSTQNFEKHQSKSASLKLMKKPGIIEFNNSQPLEIVLNKTSYFECIVHNGVPAPVFRWKLVDSLKNFINLNDAQLIEQNLSNASILYKSRIAIHGNFEYKNKKLVCEIEHPMLELQRNNNPGISRTVDIDFKYAPRLELNYESDENFIEGETYTFHCKSSGEPEPTENVIKLVDSTTDEIYNYYTSIKGELAIKMDRQMNNMVVVCESQNDIGKTTINRTLNVLYQPRFIKNPPSLITLNSSQTNIQLECNIDSNPPARIVWFNDKNELVNTGKTIDINISFSGDYSRIFSKIYGQFTCRVSSLGYQEIERTITLVRNGLPTITGKSMYLAEPGKDLEIKFSVLSIPQVFSNPVCTKLAIDEDITLRQVFAYKKQLKQYKFNEKFLDNDNITADISFIIQTISEDDFGMYNCTVSNSYGENSFIFEVQIRPSDDRFIIVLSLSILFLVLLLTVIISVVLAIFHMKVKERKNKKKSYDYSNSTKNSPNLSVSEWIANNSLSENKQDDNHNSQCEIFFDGKTTSHLDSILIYPTRHSNQSSLNSEQQLINAMNDTSLVEVRSEPTTMQAYSNHNDLNKFYQDISIFSMANYQSPSVILSKFQTNV